CIGVRPPSMHSSILCSSLAARALHLARSVRDDARTKQVITGMFSCYEANLSPKLVGVWLTLLGHLYGASDLITQAEVDRMISDLENMLIRLSTKDERNEFDAFNAQAVGEKLVQHYKKIGDTESVSRVIKTF